MELRKVNGLVNPADLFTKHLSSRERINQFVELLNCEYRDGRSATAPELRKKNAAAAVHVMQHLNVHVAPNGVHPAAGLEDPNCQSPVHDPDVLPHEYDADELDRLFEKAVAPDELDCAPTSRCICSRPDCSNCFPPRASELAPPVTNAEAWVCASPSRCVKWPRVLVKISDTAS